ncbi:hypothetical protein EBR03_10395, partial [bacterium]|nr:hypothetical protein [bacterium]
MAVISPVLLTSSLVNDVLTKIRRGVALCRMENTIDFSRGVMCDLPEKIDFELNVVSKHQFLSRQTTTSDGQSSIETDFDVENIFSGQKTTELNKEVSSENDASIKLQKSIEQEVSSELLKSTSLINARENSNEDSLDRDGEIKISSGGST